MAEGGGSGGGGGGDWLRLSSFDAASFFAQQQRQQEENRAVQGKHTCSCVQVPSLLLLVDQRGLPCCPSRSIPCSPTLSPSLLVFIYPTCCPHQTPAGQQLQAAADLLLPSSSDDDSSGSRGRDRSRGRSRSSSRGRSKPGKKRRRKEKESSRERGRRKEKEGKEKRRRQQREAEREQQVRAERATGAAQRAPQVKAWAPAKAGAAPAEPYYFDTRWVVGVVRAMGEFAMQRALAPPAPPAGLVPAWACLPPRCR